MKKITIIESFTCEKDICKKDDCAKCFTEHSKTEQVPETWEELKELCKSLTDIEDYGESVEIDNYKLTKKGDVQFCHLDNYSDYEYIIIAENRTIPQMWNIIKSLVEE